MILATLKYAGDACVYKYECDSSQNLGCANGLCQHFASDLTNYWPISSLSPSDFVGGLDMTSSNAFVYLSDRKGVNNEALNINGRAKALPNAVYFNSEFTISVWVKTTTSQSWARIFEVGQGAPNDNVILVSSYENTQMPALLVTFGSDNQNTVRCYSSVKLNIGTWYLITATFQSSIAKIYVNGVLTGSATVANMLPAATYRNQNYIGGSSWDESDSTAIIDDLRIYRRALGVTEINAILNSYPCKHEHI